MADSYPYTISNNKLPAIFDKIKTAARPEKFTQELLKKMGFTASNDRATIPILKGLGFIKEDGTPTDAYNRLKDPADHPYVLAEKIRELYKDLFALDTQMNKATDADIKGAFSRITGKDEAAVTRFANTFKALVQLGKFDAQSKVAEQKEEELPKETSREKVSSPAVGEVPDFHYNIQIHLPATTDVTVYNAIFKSIRENLT